MDNQLENNTENNAEGTSEEILEQTANPVVPTEAEIEPAAEPMQKYEDPNSNIPVDRTVPTYNYDANYDYNVTTSAGSQTGNEAGMDNRPMNMGDWLLTILVMVLLPCVGIPMYFVWAFGKNGNVNRRNYCRAYLIVMGISVVIGIIICVVIGISMFSYLPYYY